MTTDGMIATQRTSVSPMREVRHCPDCGSPLIAVPVLKCAHCGSEIIPRCFVYSPGPGRHIAECVDLDLLSQGNTPEEAIGRLQEAMDGYLKVVFEGGSTRGLVLRPSPLSRRLRYLVYRLLCAFYSVVKRRHARHVLPNSPDIQNLRFSHC